MHQYKIKIQRRMALLCVTVVLITACQTRGDLLLSYNGLQKPDTEITRLRVPNAVELISVDGVKYETPFTDKGFYEVHLLPGRHDVDFVYSEIWGDATSSTPYVSDRFRFRLDADKGLSYDVVHNGPEDPLEADISRERVRVWLQDSLSGAQLSAFARFKHGSALTRAVRKVTGFDDGDEQLVTAPTGRPAIVKSSPPKPSEAAIGAIPEPASISAPKPMRNQAPGVAQGSEQGAKANSKASSL